MIRVLILAAALATAAPAFAQTAPAPAPAPANAAAPAALEDAEFDAKAEAFGQRMQTMQTEMATVISNTAGDTARRDRELDAIVARYQPEADAFAGAVEAFAAGQAAMMPADQQAAIQARIAEALAQVRGVPNQIRTALVSAAAAAQAAPAPAGS